MCVRSALWHCHEKQGDGQSESLPSMGGRALGFVLNFLTKAIFPPFSSLLATGSGMLTTRD
jgi:hypothetical protein